MMIAFRRLCVLAAISLIASGCKSDRATAIMGPAPPAIWFEASTHVMPQTNAPSALEVLTWIYNRTNVTLDVFVGAQCPVGVQFYPYPSGGSLTSSMACPSGQSK